MPTRTAPRAGANRNANARISTTTVMPVCICGLPYTGHPPADAPSACYRTARRDYIVALSQRMPFPDMSDIHRRAVIRRRLDCAAVIAA